MRLVKIDECGDIIVPDVKDKKLYKQILTVLTDGHFSHEGWLQYDFYLHDAAAIICDLVEKSKIKERTK